MLATVLAILVAGATWISAQEISGRVTAMEGGAPVAGAILRLLHSKDSTVSDADGNFRLPVSAVAVRPPKALTGGLDAALAGKEIAFFAPAKAAVRIELFDLKGKRLAYRAYRPAIGGRQRLNLGGMLGGLRGLGWMRIDVDGRLEWIRAMDIGFSGGDLPKSISGNMGAGGAAEGVPRSKRAIGSLDTEGTVPEDTLVVEKAGYYEKVIYLIPLIWSRIDIQLWKNSIHGLDSTEVRAWKEHLAKPVQLIKVTHNSVTLPNGRTGGAILMPDGKEATTWSTDPCDPGPFPVSIWFEYTQGGREYRDTVPLAAIRALQASFRSTKDSLNQFNSQYHFTWLWPGTVSAVPERDWMQLDLPAMAGDRYSLSRPDVFQVGVRYGIEGGLLKFGEFLPSSGSFSMPGPSRTSPGFKAEFTLARRDDHDVRIRVDHLPPYPMSKNLVFTNAWPAGGVFHSGQVLTLQASSRIPSLEAPLVMMTQPRLEGWSHTIKTVWDGSALEWKFPYPVLDTVTVRLHAHETGGQGCPATLESPDLRVIKDPADTSVGAFEPNDGPEAAALVPKGRWIQAAWHFRTPWVDRDPDYYRFRAIRGERIRISLHNPNLDIIALYQEFDLDNSGFTAYPGKDASQDFDIPADGEYTFELSQLDLPAGRCSFRIDSLD